MVDMVCPIKGCNKVLFREDMVLNAHLRQAHNCSHEQRIRLRQKYTHQESGFGSPGITSEERALCKTLGI